MAPVEQLVKSGLVETPFNLFSYDNHPDDSAYRGRVTIANWVTSLVAKGYAQSPWWLVPYYPGYYESKLYQDRVLSMADLNQLKVSRNVVASVEFDYYLDSDDYEDVAGLDEEEVKKDIQVRTDAVVASLEDKDVRLVVLVEAAADQTNGRDIKAYSPAAYRAYINKVQEEKMSLLKFGARQPAEQQGRKAEKASRSSVLSPTKLYDLGSVMIFGVVSFKILAAALPVATITIIVSIVAGLVSLIIGGVVIIRHKGQERKTKAEIQNDGAKGQGSEDSRRILRAADKAGAIQSRTGLKEEAEAIQERETKRGIRITQATKVAAFIIVMLLIPNLVRAASNITVGTTVEISSPWEALLIAMTMGGAVTLASIIGTLRSVRSNIRRRISRKKIAQQRNIHLLVRTIYGRQQTEEILQGLEALIDRYTARIKQWKTKDLTFNERDVALITYPDMFNHKADEYPLETLNRFLKALSKVGQPFTVLHLLPRLFPYSVDEGFGTVDHTRIDEKQGTWEMVESIIKQHDLKLMLDFIVGHVASDHPWFIEFLRGNKAYRDFFIYFIPKYYPKAVMRGSKEVIRYFDQKGQEVSQAVYMEENEYVDQYGRIVSKEDFDKVVRPRSHPLLTPYKLANGQTILVWTTFSAQQVDLNWRNPKLFLAMMEVMFILLSHGTKILRLDAVPYMWKEMGHRNIHHDNAHLMVKLFRAILDKMDVEVVILPEINAPYGEALEYSGIDGDEGQMLYNFALANVLLYTFLAGDKKELIKFVQKTQTVEDIYMLNVLRQHDGIALRSGEDILGRKQEKIIELWRRYSKAQFGLELISQRAVNNISKVRKAASKITEKLFGRKLYTSQKAYELNTTIWDLMKAIVAETHKEDLVKEQYLAIYAVLMMLKGVPGFDVKDFLAAANNMKEYERTGMLRSVHRSPETLAEATAQIMDENRPTPSIIRMLAARAQHRAFAPQSQQIMLNSDQQVLIVVRRTIDKEETVIGLVNLTSSKKTVRLSTKQLNQIGLGKGQNLSLQDFVGQNALGLYQVGEEGIQVRLTPYQAVIVEKEQKADEIQKKAASSTTSTGLRAKIRKIVQGAFLTSMILTAPSIAKAAGTAKTTTMVTASAMPWLAITIVAAIVVTVAAILIYSIWFIRPAFQTEAQSAKATTHAGINVTKRGIYVALRKGRARFITAPSAAANIKDYYLSIQENLRTLARRQNVRITSVAIVGLDQEATTELGTYLRYDTGLDLFWMKLDQKVIGTIGWEEHLKNAKSGLRGVGAEQAMKAAEWAASNYTKKGPFDVYKVKTVMETGEVVVTPLMSRARYEETTPKAIWQNILFWRKQLRDVTIIDINSTAQGGGVALMLHAFQRLIRFALGVDARWFVMNGNGKVFHITKNSFHNTFQGRLVRALSEEDKELLRQNWGENAQRLEPAIAQAKDEIVIFNHDYQPSGMMPYIQAMADKYGKSIKWIYRSHIHFETDMSEGTVARANWDFLWQNIKKYAHLVIIQPTEPIEESVPANVVAEKPTVVMNPSTDRIDDLNMPHSAETIQDALERFNAFLGTEAGTSKVPGVIAQYIADNQQEMKAWFGKRRIRINPELMTPLDLTRESIVQIARMDPSKNIPGAVEAYYRFWMKMKEYIKENKLPDSAMPQLILAGHGAVDDTDGMKLYIDTLDRIQQMYPAEFARDVKVARLPHNDHVLNALLRRSQVALQLSLAEGYEIKVSEAIDKEIPVIAYRVGGIGKQILNGKTGYLIDVVEELAQYGKVIPRQINQPLVQPAEELAYQTRSLDEVAGHLFALFTDKALYEEMKRNTTELVEDNKFNMAYTMRRLGLAAYVLRHGEVAPTAVRQKPVDELLDEEMTRIKAETEAKPVVEEPATTEEAAAEEAVTPTAESQAAIEEEPIVALGKAVGQVAARVKEIKAKLERPANILFAGTPGSKKTTFIKQIEMILYEEGFEVVTVKTDNQLDVFHVPFTQYDALYPSADVVIVEATTLLPSDEENADLYIRFDGSLLARQQWITEKLGSFEFAQIATSAPEAPVYRNRQPDMEYITDAITLAFVQSGQLKALLSRGIKDALEAAADTPSVENEPVQIEREARGETKVIRYRDQQGRVMREEINKITAQTLRIFYYKNDDTVPYYTFEMVSDSENEFDLESERTAEAVENYAKVIREESRMLKKEGIEPEELIATLTALLAQGKIHTVAMVIKNLSDMIHAYKYAAKGFSIYNRVPGPNRFEGSFTDFIKTVAYKGLVRGIATELVRVDLDYNAALMGIKNAPHFTFFYNRINERWARKTAKDIHEAEGRYEAITLRGPVTVSEAGEPVILNFDLERLMPIRIMGLGLELAPRHQGPVALNALTSESKRTLVEKLALETEVYPELDLEWRIAQEAVREEQRAQQQPEESRDTQAVSTRGVPTINTPAGQVVETSRLVAEIMVNPRFAALTPYLEGIYAYGSSTWYNAPADIDVIIVVNTPMLTEAVTESKVKTQLGPIQYYLINLAAPIVRPEEIRKFVFATSMIFAEGLIIYPGSEGVINQLWNKIGVDVGSNQPYIRLLDYVSQALQAAKGSINLIETSAEYGLKDSTRISTMAIAIKNVTIPAKILTKIMAELNIRKPIITAEEILALRQRGRRDQVELEEIRSHMIQLRETALQVSKDMVVKNNIFRGISRETVEELWQLLPAIKETMVLYQKEFTAEEQAVKERFYGLLEELKQEGILSFVGDSHSLNYSIFKLFESKGLNVPNYRDVKETFRYITQNIAQHADGFGLILIKLAETGEEGNAIEALVLDQGKGFIDQDGRHVPIQAAVESHAQIDRGGVDGLGLTLTVENAVEISIETYSRDVATGYYWAKGMDKEIAIQGSDAIHGSKLELKITLPEERMSSIKLALEKIKAAVKAHGAQSLKTFLIVGLVGMFAVVAQAAGAENALMLAGNEIDWSLLKVTTVIKLAVVIIAGLIIRYIMRRRNNKQDPKDKDDNGAGTLKTLLIAGFVALFADAARAAGVEDVAQLAGNEIDWSEKTVPTLLKLAAVIIVGLIIRAIRRRRRNNQETRKDDARGDSKSNRKDSSKPDKYGYIGNLGKLTVDRIKALANEERNYVEAQEQVDLMPEASDIPALIRYFNVSLAQAPPEGFIWARIENVRGERTLVIYFSSKQLLERLRVVFSTDAERQKAYQTIISHEMVELETGSHETAEERTTLSYPITDARIKSIFAHQHVKATPVSVQDETSLIQTAPIAQTDELIMKIMRRLPEPIEFGWFYGSTTNSDYLTDVYLPIPLGISEAAYNNGNNFKSESWNDRIRRRTLIRLIGGDFALIDTYIAARPETNEVGVQLISSISEDETGIYNKSSTFLPLTQLLNYKDIVAFLPPAVQKQFIGKTPQQLYTAIMKQQTVENTFAGVVRIDIPLRVGQYGLRQSYLPVNQAITRILKDNVVDDGTIIGEGHHHFKRTKPEHEANPFFDELDAIVASLPLTKRTKVPGHEKYISPEDGRRIISASAKFNDVTRGEKDPDTGLVTIHVIDPETRELIIKTYFDVVGISNNEQDAKTFRNLSIIGSETTSRDVLEEFYAVVDKYTSTEAPELVAEQGYLGNIDQKALKEIERLAEKADHYVVTDDQIGQLREAANLPLEVRYFNVSFKHAPSEGFIWARIEKVSGQRKLVVYFSSQRMFNRLQNVFPTTEERMTAYQAIATHEIIEIKTRSHEQAEAQTARAFPITDAKIKSIFNEKGTQVDVIHGHNGYKLIEQAPIAQTDELIMSIMKRLPEPIEFGWFYGSTTNSDYLTDVYLPVPLGISEAAYKNGNNFHSESWNDRIRRRTLIRLIGGDFSYIDAYLAARPETREVGVQLISSIPEDEAGIFNKTSVFIPLAQLLLHVDIIEYLSPDMQQQLSGKSEADLYKIIIGQQTPENTFAEIIRLDTPLKVGQYGLRQSYLPVNQAITRILKQNVVDDGTIIGEGHHHFKRTEEEHAANPFFDELDAIVAKLSLTKRTGVPGHEKYISPEDGRRIISASAKFNDITRGEKDPDTGLVTIHVIHPVTRELIIKTYFDVVAISNNDEDAKQFRNLSIIGSETTSSDILQDFYKLVDKYTSTEAPELVMAGYLGNLGDTTVQELNAIADQESSSTEIARYVSRLRIGTTLPIQIRYFNVPLAQAPPEGFIWARYEEIEGRETLVIYFSSEAKHMRFNKVFKTQQDRKAAYTAIAFHEVIENQADHEIAETLTTAMYPKMDKRIKTVFKAKRSFLKIIWSLIGLSLFNMFISVTGLLWPMICLAKQASH